MWAKTYPVKYLVPFKQKDHKSQFYLWFSPTQALERTSSVELTAVWPIRTPSILATYVTLSPIEASYYEDMFFVGIGEKWVRFDGTVEIDGKSNPVETQEATIQYLYRIADGPLVEKNVGAPSAESFRKAVQAALAARATQTHQ